MEKLSTNELRIGNLVIFTFTNEIVEVAGINAHEEIDLLSNKTIINSIIYKKDLDFYCDLIDKINPILLTEEWLLKLGYLKEDENFIAFGHFISGYCCDFFSCKRSGVTLLYVHQLQNLYFALTGYELTLKK